MKNIILLIAVMVVSACATTPTKPVIELTPELLNTLNGWRNLGEYESKNENGTTFKQVFLDNGIYEWYENGKKEEAEFKWSIVKGEIHVIRESGDIAVWWYNKDRSITQIARILTDGKREDFPKEFQTTFKKIK